MTFPPTRHAGRFEVTSFAFFGVVGFAAACGVAVGLTAARDLSLLDEAAVIAAAVATFAGLAAVSRRTLIYYHHEIAVLAVAAAVAAFLGAPVLGHLDATALGLGAFLSLGRVGCLHAGCCHGRPARRGVVYGPAHLVERYLQGRVLVPVQALESAAVLSLAAAGSLLVAAGAAPGAGFAVYVCGYALLRFPLELLRGDASRRWWGGFSEAQWTSLGAASVMALLGLSGVLPGPAVLPLVAPAVLVALAALQREGVLGRPSGALDPRHVRELAALLGRAEAGGVNSVPKVLSTSLGLRVTYGTGGGVDHWTLSGATPTAAQAMARVILSTRRPDADAELVRGPGDLLHVVVPR